MIFFKVLMGGGGDGNNVNVRPGPVRDSDTDLALERPKTQWQSAIMTKHAVLKFNTTWLLNDMAVNLLHGC